MGDPASPPPGAARLVAPELFLLDEMAAQGLSTGPFNLPTWEDHVEGFRRCLESLFRHTPPTALIIEEVPHFIAALQFCGKRGYRVPGDVSLVCATSDPGFAMCTPSVAYVRWSTRPLVRRVMRWTESISRGKENCRQSLIKAEFVEGGTIGPAGG